MALSLRTTPAAVHKEMGMDQSRESEEQSPMMRGCRLGMDSYLETDLEGDCTERKADLLLLLFLLDETRRAVLI